MLRRLLVAVLATWYQAKLEAESRARGRHAFDPRDPERVAGELSRDVASPRSDARRFAFGKLDGDPQEIYRETRRRLLEPLMAPSE